MPTNLGRNDPCHCGSGKKYKQCHLAADEAAERAARVRAEAEAPLPQPEPLKPAHTGGVAPKATRQPWKRGAVNTHGFHKVTAPRKVGGN